MAFSIVSTYKDRVFFRLRCCALAEMRRRDGQTGRRTAGPTTERLWLRLFLMLQLVCEAVYVASSYVTAQLLMSLRVLYVGQSVRRGKEKKTKQSE